MNVLQKYADQFYESLEVYEDIEKGHSYKGYMRQAVKEFLEDETKDAAFSVYRAFFDSYRISIGDEGNQFIDLLDVLKNYEENAATLIDKQRDHYIHSVNCFVLGICIYSANKNVRAAFDAVIMDKQVYSKSYDTKHEEFYYRWGLASLFHDVGYPVEIIGRQINKFMGFATDIDGGEKVKSHLVFENFGSLNSIQEIVSKREFIKDYYNRYESCVYVDLLKPIDLLAHKLHISLGVNVKETKDALDDFINVMAKFGFVDHGFYSALIVLKWYGYLIQKCGYDPEYFFYPILDSASAILLHNYYKNAIMKKPFSLGPLSINSHPLAFLLILCDELQEWNREAYGIIDKQRAHASEAPILITDDRLYVTYIAGKGELPEQFAKEKEELFRSILDMDSVFGSGFSIGCEAKDAFAPMVQRLTEGSVVPRPLLDNMERLAIAIHGLYNQKQLERYPDKELKYPSFSDLSDSLKYSNLRQARGISDKLAILGCKILKKGSSGKVVHEIPKDTVEFLAEFEHNEWVKERKDSGWKNSDEKIPGVETSEYLVPYNELTEDIKDLDRDTIRNIPQLLDMIGMAAYKV